MKGAVRFRLVRRTFFAQGVSHDFNDNPFTAKG
jgi:hypothetical protein